MKEISMNLQLFGAGENIFGTEGMINAKDGTVSRPVDESGLSAEMKTYYADYLIDNAEAALVHDRWAQKHKIPAGSGKSVQFRKYDPLPKLTQPIAEGVTPTGQTINMGIVNATVAQYGGYVELSDLLLMTAIDNNLCMATKLLGSQAGRTLDTISREVLVGGTNVQYGEGQVSSRDAILGGSDDPDENCYMTVEAIRRAVRFLKNQNAEKIDGAYIAIIHPNVAYDLMNDPNWRYPHQYAEPSAIFEGEIGKLEGVRFIECTEAKVFHAPDLAKNMRTLKIDKMLSDANIVTFTDSAKVDPDSLIGREVFIEGNKYFVKANDSSSIELYEDPLFEERAYITCPAATLVYPGEAGAYGTDVYATLIFGENAYGTTELANGGLEHIVKQLGSGGSSDPLNQRATVGWKATKVTVRLVEAFMIRIETAASAQFA
jgi:N4-gp56 family major capsid protein